MIIKQTYTLFFKQSKIYLNPVKDTYIHEQGGINSQNLISTWNSYVKEKIVKLTGPTIPNKYTYVFQEKEKGKGGKNEKQFELWKSSLYY